MYSLLKGHGNSAKFFNKQALFFEKLLYLRHDQSQQDTINTVFLPRRHENTNNNQKGTLSQKETLLTKHCFMQCQEI